MSDLLYFNTLLRQVYVGNFTDVCDATLNNELETVMLRYSRNLKKKIWLVSLLVRVRMLNNMNLTKNLSILRSSSISFLAVSLNHKIELRWNFKLRSNLKFARVIKCTVVNLIYDGFGNRLNHCIITKIVMDAHLWNLLL